ncbi:hypothetical protein K1T71_007771 [Dendrolimus kikuchii]|uniref:Uncharacterized protein n=1 Tax=Dendrolimus kikuchii TaxID=765133 RepID=A0ACC1CZ81_9NEOP|nr:hypothetical protein K1T71_007771 [Dendrolimus kikuchii]
MSFFHPEIRTKEKEIYTHPWENRIKDVYQGKIKHAHNSIRNPQYPEKKVRQPYPERLKFTIIGNRTSKEFIYCTKLVTGMHKYRWKNFESPIIRGVTSIEWPAVWNDLKMQYGGLAFCLKSQVAVLINEKFLGGEDELRELIETKYIYYICPDYYNEAIGQFASFFRSSGRPCAYMHIAIDKNHIGTLIFMLYSEIVPYTSENFLRLCKTKKGGYSGTPIHRIVKDGWIQCGGYGLKDTELDCENFIIPHDRRGVLCMANDGRHIDCSTQFFVLLQPATWIAHKYVAFGQLIEGEETLKKIEEVPTWYESPKRSIEIHQAGIFNMECQDIIINKGAKEYIHSHIEDLFTVGELFYEALIEKVFLEVELRYLERLRKEAEGEGEVEQEEMPDKNIHETKRFLRKKEDIQKQLEKSQVETRRARSVTIDAEENNEFDVDEYVYEPEEYIYKHVSIAATVSVVVKPEKPYYIPLTDVPYPGEVDSTYDLKKFLKGDYCLESDLTVNPPKSKVYKEKESFPSGTIGINTENSVSEEEESLDSDDEREIRKYLKMNVDRVSFAGGVIKSIARTKSQYDIFGNTRKSELITDEELRRQRLASATADSKNHELREKNVSISVPETDSPPHAKIKRRQTGFVRPADLLNIRDSAIMPNVQESESLADDQKVSTAEMDMSRKVRIAASAGTLPVAPHLSARRPTGFVRRVPPDKESEVEVTRQSVLTRLYDDVTQDDDDQPGPTLKDYKPISELHPKTFSLLTYSPCTRINCEEENKERFRQSITVEDESYAQVLNMQHGKKVARKISSDYVKTIDQMEHKLETSIRSVEFAKTRPAMSVTQYQMKNQRYQDEQKAKMVTKALSNLDNKSAHGLRLPGDTPLYSQSLQQVDVHGCK